MKIASGLYCLFDNKATNWLLDEELKLTMCFSEHAVADSYGYEMSFIEKDPL